MATTTTTNHGLALWRVRISSALRTTVACTIVGCTTLYGPEPLRRIPAFPAFSYVTTILIVSDATLGDTLKGCWHALYASVQVMMASILFLGLIGPCRFTSGLAALAVAVAAFVVALPESTNLMAKRLAFGQIVIVFVGTVIHGAETGVVMHPIHVATSTALGASAAILAMLLPYPRLAYFEVKQTCRLYAENASERLNLFVKAFSAQDNTTARGLISEARFLFRSGAKLLLSIRHRQDVISWERPQIRFLKPSCWDPRQKLEELETPIRGMELALTSCDSFPIDMIDEELTYVLESLKAQICLKLEQAKCSAFLDATTAPEIKQECTDKSLSTLKTISSTKNVPASFFLYCLEILQDGLPIARNTECMVKNKKKTNTDGSNDPQNLAMSKQKGTWSSHFVFPSSESLIFALKCSLSLGLAVLFGLIYNKQSAYWSGLTIAISFSRNRQATFTVANARAQGTAMGSVYGILCYFIFQKLDSFTCFQKFDSFRFLLLLPWIIFYSFLRHSRMYGEAGGISAVIGVLLILGRKNYGTPSEFAIARITEATIGLICFTTVEILFRPTRVATLARNQLGRCLGVLRDGIKDIVIYANQKPTARTLEDRQKNLKSLVSELENFIAEAESEPNFWFVPFHSTCYHELLGSLTRMADLLLFVSHNAEFLSQVSERYEVAWKELQEQINNDLERFKEKVGYSLKCLEEVILVKSLAKLEKELRKNTASHDIELGKSPNEDVHRTLGPLEEEVEEILSSFLQHSNQVANQINTNDVEEKLKNQIVLRVNSLGFCISSLMKETRELEKEIRELLKWENPTRHINFYEISSNLNILSKK